MSDVILRTEKLVHTYPTGVTALREVSVDFYRNDVVSIVGQNGSGKTTLVRHFNGLLRPSSGKVYVDGEDVSSKSVSAMSRKVGYVFQNPNHQIFCTTVRDELAVAPKNYGFSPGEIEDNIGRVVELMGLEPILKTHPLTLDYTTKKIVTIASVLVYNPPIVILDEPTGGLDQAGREMLSKIIQITHDAGHTMIIISHDMDYVAENSRRIIVMTGGKIILNDTPWVIFNNKEVMRQAQIEPPQITRLDLAVRADDNPSLSVGAFVEKYRNRKNV
ncbi:MAG: energy-coupling factor ABC transporter ATP-binding protein [Treponema sp.]|jgi:energy-coupling factor transport system ATP-binding protein|nr:energy-coupling factor ABC transporter ATP-binding protein [Treponema sp.]